MSYCRTIVFLGLFSVFAAVGIASAADYVFTPLQPLGSDLRDYGFGVTLVGSAPEVVGKSGPMLAGAYYQGTPTVWNSEGAGTSVFPSISGAAAATASAVDTSGNVVGWSTSTTTQYGTKQAFYLPSGGTAATILPDLSTNTTNTYSYSAAQGLNAAGYVVGESVATDGNTHPVVWTNTAGTWSVADLGALDPTIAGWAYAINSSNVVAGWCNDAVNGFDYQDAATWTYDASTSTWTPHSLVDRAVYSTGGAAALAINSSGNAVGWSSVAIGTPDFNHHAVEFSDGAIVSLGSLGRGGSASDAAEGVNDSGVIVGTSALTSGAFHAFIWDSTDGMRDVNTVFANEIPAGWTLTSATGIDNNGDIVGYGTNGTYNEGFLLTGTLPGDANGDGKVDINDLTIVLSHYGQTGMSWGQGEFTGDGTVDINDLTIVLAHYGQSLGASGAGNLSDVPEPSTLALIGGGAIGLLGLAWRRRRPARHVHRLEKK